MGIKNMNWSARIAFFLMLIEVIASFSMGFTYIFRSGLTPYHEIMIGEKFTDLKPGIQDIITILKGGTGYAGIQNGLILLLLLFVPFMKRHSWTRWGIPLANLMHRIPFFIVAVMNTIHTGAPVPWPIQSLGVVISILFFILTSGYLSDKK